MEFLAELDCMQFKIQNDQKERIGKGLEKSKIKTKFLVLVLDKS